MAVTESLYDKASLLLVPSGVKAANVYSQKPYSGDGDFTFDRNSTATRVNAAGYIETVAADIPRLDFPIVNGEVKDDPALLLEPSRTNVITYSDDFTQSSWSKLNGGTGTAPSITADYAISPDGTKNATRIVLDKGSGITSGDYSAISDVIGSFTGDGTFSVYLKSNTSTDYVVSQRIEDDRQQVTVTSEWKRFVFSRSSLNNGTSGLWLRGGYGSDDYADILVWGAQTENASYATSYIPTSGSSVTRSAETCNSAGDSSLFNDSEGVLFIEAKALNDDGTNRIISLSDGSNDNRLNFYYRSTSNQILVRQEGNNGTPKDITFDAGDTTLYHKYAIKYDSSNMDVFFDGVDKGNISITAFASNSLDTLNFDSPSNTEDFYGRVKQIAVFNEALTDAELTTLTS